jgi:hypothetical protein
VTTDRPPYARAPPPNRRRRRSRAAPSARAARAGLPRPVPGAVPAVHHRPALYGLVMSFFDTSLVKPGLGRVRRPRQLRRGAAERRLLVVAVAHRLVHHPDHAAADRAGAGASRCSPTGPSAAGGSSGWRSSLPYILPSAVVALIWIFALHAGAGPARDRPRQDRASPSRTGSATRTGPCPRWRSPRSGGRSASTSCSTWPACRRSRATSTRRRRWTAPARGSRSARSPSRCWAAPPRWWRCCR